MSKFAAMRSFLTILLILMWMQAYGQGQPSVSDVKLSGRYHWGEGFSTDRQQAIDLARQDLVQKMVVTITAEQNMTLTDNGSGPSSNFELRSKSLSRMQLRGLDYIVNQRRDQSFQATAFVSKQEFDQTMSDLRNRILTQMSQMNASKQRGNLSAAISQAFDILVQTYFIPIPIFADSVEVQSYVRAQLSAWLMDAAVTVPTVANRSAPGHTELSLETSVRFGSESANDLLVQLNRPGYGEHPVRSGRADVFMDVEPELPTQTIELRLMPVIPASLDTEMKALAQEIRPSRIVSVPVNFKPVMSLDFNVTKLLGAGYRFTAQFSNLSVFDLSWDFGNGESSTQASPRVEMPAMPASGRPITLVVNRSPDLTIRKVLMPDGTLRAPGNTPAPVVVTPTPTPVPNTIVAIDQISLSQRNHLDPLLRIRNAAAFTDQLERLKQQNVVRYGRSSDVGPIERSYVAIVDPADRSIKTVLTPLINGVRYDLSNNEPVAPETMRDRFQGMGSIWFSFI
jgi:hypothetical protein